jgi:hypothetical protein
MLAIRPREQTPASAVGVKGVLVLVDGGVKKSSMPMKPDEVGNLVQEVGVLAACYSDGGLPPKAFFVRFDKSSLMVLFARRNTVIIWMENTASVSEIEIAGRKLASTAHLSGAHRTDSILLPSNSGALPKGPAKPANIPASAARSNKSNREFIVPPHSTLTKIMSWSEASYALESILTKVLTHAQAARMIERTLAEKGIDPNGPFDLISFREIGSSLMLKIPNRSIRQSLTKEFDALVANLS